MTFSPCLFAAIARRLTLADALADAVEAWDDYFGSVEQFGRLAVQQRERILEALRQYREATK